jgi:DNA-binding IclR family transcriptional regulator
MTTEPARNLDDDRDSAKSLRKALAILEAVGSAETAPTIAEVALKTGVSRPTAYRLMRTLIDEGFIRQDGQSGRLMVGLSVLTLAASLLDTNRLRLEALPHLQSLSGLTGERTNLGILHRNRVLYLGGVEKPTLPMIYSRFGKTAPVHCCSLGKAMLAHQPKMVLDAVLAAAPLTAETPNSITSMSRFTKELELTRRRGYATDREEHVLHSCCIAVPIFDGQRRAVGAVGVSGSDIEDLLNHLGALQHTAELISHRL